MSYSLSKPHSWLNKEPVKFGKKLLGEMDVEVLLQRLDRLMQEESQTAATLTLEVVHDLAKNLKVVMDCELHSLGFQSYWAEFFCPDERSSADNTRQVICMLGTLAEIFVIDCFPASLQYLVSNEIRKIRK